jgi:hypothetical protein
VIRVPHTRPADRRPPTSYLVLAAAFGGLAGGFAALGLCTGTALGMPQSVTLAPAGTCLVFAGVFLLLDVFVGRR